ncbi:MAG: ubiquinone/menaquinone biosynthesis methyltransferase [Alphaproteobacteria bacterium]|nr:ubiquinone/menaquinone biosynthesis methyltransferase [Alphaproteobacteria bacterium]
MDAGERLKHSFGATRVDEEERRRLIRETFAGVAPRYDLMNDLMSTGIHRIWKAALVRHGRPNPEDIVLDLGGGTGDIAFALAASAAHVLVADPSPQMMGQGQAREGQMREGQMRQPAPGITWVAAEAEALPFTDGSIDLVVISFAIRNATNIERALGEIARVLKPGGRFHCLEFSTPQPWLAPFYGMWSRTVIPVLGAVVSGERRAYRYLIESIRQFPDQAEFAGLIAASGMTDVSWRNLSFGIAALHSARKP